MEICKIFFFYKFYKCILQFRHVAEIWVWCTIRCTLAGVRGLMPIIQHPLYNAISQKPGSKKQEESTRFCNFRLNLTTIWEQITIMWWQFHGTINLQKLNAKCKNICKVIIINIGVSYFNVLFNLIYFCNIWIVPAIH